MVINLDLDLDIAVAKRKPEKGIYRTLDLCNVSAVL